MSSPQGKRKLARESSSDTHCCDGNQSKRPRTTDEGSENDPIKDVLVNGRILDILEKGLLTDLKILVNDESFDAHKQLLAIHSPLFEKMLNPSQENLTVSEISTGTFPFYLRMMYDSTIEPQTLEQAFEILTFAQTYQLFHVQQRLNNYVMLQLNCQNIWTILNSGFLETLPILRQNVIAFICRNGSEILGSPQFPNINYNLFLDIVKRDDLKVSSETEVFNAAKKWAKHQCEKKNMPASTTEMRNELGEIFNNIRFRTLTFGYLSYNIFNSWLSPKEVLSSVTNGDSRTICKNVTHRGFPSVNSQVRTFCEAQLKYLIALRQVRENDSQFFIEREYVEADLKCSEKCIIHSVFVFGQVTPNPEALRRTPSKRFASYEENLLIKLFRKNELVAEASYREVAQRNSIIYLPLSKSIICKQNDDIAVVVEVKRPGFYPNTISIDFDEVHHPTGPLHASMIVQTTGGGFVAAVLCETFKL